MFVGAGFARAGAGEFAIRSAPPPIALGEIKSIDAYTAALRQLAGRGPVAGNTALALYDEAGNVTLQVYAAGSSGTYRIIWEGGIGTVPVSGVYGTAPFGNAVEPWIRDLVGNATGQTFRFKAPWWGGPDLIPR